MTWNIEVFNERNENEFHQGNPNGPRTDAQLDQLASRILGFDASVIALQEMNQVTALYDLRDRMNGGANGSWSVVANTGQQNALLYNDDKVDLVSSAFVLFKTGNGPELYPNEFGFRAPVTGVFTPEGQPDNPFRLIGIHGSFQTEEIRAAQGIWLAEYVDEFLTAPNETDQILLIGDMNGQAVAGDAPHDGIVSMGQLTNVSKSDDQGTTFGGQDIDSVYVTDAAAARLPDPTSYVIRADYYGETTTEFRATYSDHYPVFIDYVVSAIPEPGSSGCLLVSCLLLKRRRRC